MQERQMKKWFLLVAFAFVISSASVILVPFSIGGDGNLNVVGYISGVMFWTGLLTGTVGYILLNKKADVHSENEEKRKIPDVCRFFSNTPAKVMDTVLIIGIIGMIYSVINAAVSEIVTIIFLLFLLSGIYSHILLNGRIYRYIEKTTDICNKSAINQKKMEECKDEK